MEDLIGHMFWVALLLLCLAIPVCATVGALGIFVAWREVTADEDWIGKVKYAWAGALCLFASPGLWWCFVELVRYVASQW